LSEARIADPNLSLSEERSARAEGKRRERCDAGPRNQARLPFAASQKVALVSGGSPETFALRLDELALAHCLALHLSRRHRFSIGLRRPLLGQGGVKMGVN